MRCISCGFCILLLSRIISSIINPFRGGIHIFRETADELLNELRYRKHSVDQCRQEIHSKIWESIDKFSTQVKAQRDPKLYYFEKIDEACIKSLVALNRQKKIVEDMRRRDKIKSPPNLHDNVKQYENHYDNNIAIKPYGLLRNRDFLQKKKRLLKNEKLDHTLLQQNIEAQIKLVTNRFQGDICITIHRSLSM